MKKRKHSVIKIIANILWVILGGFWTALAWAFLGCLLCITIIGIPLGVQCFKAARLTFFPYGKKVVTNYDKHPIANMLWAMLIGWEIAVAYFVLGIINCITIIGIPHGLQCFKLMKLAFIPFGAIIVK